MRAECSPCHESLRRQREQPDVAQADMNLLVVRNARYALVSTLHVFFGGNHASKCSRYTEREEGIRQPL